MALSLALIILFGMLAGKLFELLRLPALLGMLAAGILLGNTGFSVIHPDIMRIAPDLRIIALVVILLRAGFGIDKEQLLRLGRPAVLLSFLPAAAEIAVITAAAAVFLGLPLIEAALLGCVIAAVSPAVIVPAMLRMIEQRKGEDSGVPTLVLTAASADDVLVITLFSAAAGIYASGAVRPVMLMLSVPVSLAAGILAGAVTALLIMHLFDRFPMRDTKKTLVILSSLILLYQLEGAVADVVPMASLLGVMTVGFVLHQRERQITLGLAAKFSKIWIFAELMLFVLIGAQVEFAAARDAGWIGFMLILFGLAARSIGVLLALVKTPVSTRHRWFAVAALTPKATVQAAVGAVPLAMGVPSGELILALSVLSIMLTAPLGSVAIRVLSRRWFPPES